MWHDTKQHYLETRCQMRLPIHWRLLKDEHLPKNGNFQLFFLETHLSSQRQLWYEENMCNYRVCQGNWVRNSVKTMKKIKFPFKRYLHKSPQRINPAVSFSTSYNQGALEGRYLSCFKLPHSRGLRKEPLHLPWLGNYLFPTLNCS